MVCCPVNISFGNDNMDLKGYLILTATLCGGQFSPFHRAIKYCAAASARKYVMEPEFESEF